MKILFVDPFASTRYLATGLREAGIQMHALYTQSQVSDYIKIQADLFSGCYFLSDYASLGECIEALSQQQFDRVYYGAEISVAAADKIAAALTPNFANKLECAHYRSDKFAMQEALAEAGLNHVKQMKVGSRLSEEEIQRLMEWNFPVILKPLNGAASKGVVRCENIHEVRSALDNEANTNPFGQAIYGNVVQEFISGPEYFVDTFSVKGRHYISGVQRYQRHLNSPYPICLYSEVVSANSIEGMQCIEFVEQVLSAVGLRHGFSHTEIILSERGPYLIEVNPRISGAQGFGNKLFKYCGLMPQDKLLIESCTNEVLNPIVTPTCHGRVVCLQNYENRVINELNVDLLNTLPSFKEAMMLKPAGAKVDAPKNLLDTIAFAILAHADFEQMTQDYEQLLAWEKTKRLF